MSLSSVKVLMMSLIMTGEPKSCSSVPDYWITKIEGIWLKVPLGDAGFFYFFGPNAHKKRLVILYKRSINVN